MIKAKNVLALLAVLGIIAVFSVFMLPKSGSLEEPGRFVTPSVEDMFHGKVIKKAPGGPPPAISAAPLWQREGALAFTGDTVVAAQDKGYYDTEVAALNPRDGSPRWSIQAGQPLPGNEGASFTTLTDSSEELAVIPGDEGNGIVPVKYAYFACNLCPRSSLNMTEEFGVAGISLATGETVWKYPAVPSVPTDQDTDEDLLSVGVVGTTVLAVVALDHFNNSSLSEVPKRNEQIKGTRTVAFDGLTGEKLWEVEDSLRLKGVIGEIALAYVAAPNTADSPKLVALDPRTGKEKYDYGDRFGGTSMTYARGDYAVSVKGDIVNLSSGKILATSKDQLSFCVGDDSVIACNSTIRGVDEVSYNRLVTYDIRAQRFGLAINAMEEEHSYPDAMWEGHIVADNRDTADAYVYDQSGARTATMTGVPVAATDAYVVLRSTDPAVRTLSVHSVQR